MESQLVFGFMLYVNEQQVPEFFRTLQAAQRDAEQYLSGKASLRIVSTDAPAPMRTWNYDYAIQKWVELSRG